MLSVDCVVDAGLLVLLVLLDLTDRVFAVLGHGDDLTRARFDRDQGVSGARGVAHRNTVLDLFVSDLLNVWVEAGLIVSPPRCRNAMRSSTVSPKVSSFLMTFST